MDSGSNHPVSILILEHEPADIELLQYELKKGGLALFIGHRAGKKQL